MTAGMPDIDLSPPQWTIVRDLPHKHVPDATVWAFGSRATRHAKPYSDLDILIDNTAPIPLDAIAALSDDLSESDLPYKVDIVDWATAREDFRRAIEGQRVLLQRSSTSPRPPVHTDAPD